MICLKCGSEIDDNSSFCPNCGEKIQTNNFTPFNNEQKNYYNLNNQSIGLGVASLVLGILAIVSFWSIIPPVIFAVLSIVFGAIQISKKCGKAMSIAGIITSIIGIILVVIMFIFAMYVTKEEIRTGRYTEDYIEDYFNDINYYGEEYYFE